MTTFSYSELKSYCIEHKWRRTVRPSTLIHRSFCRPLSTHSHILALNTYIIFVLDHDRDEVYPILNWSNGSFKLDGEDFPISTVGLFAIFIFVFATIFHVAFYGLTRIKFCIRAQKSTQPYGSHDMTSDHVTSGHVRSIHVIPGHVVDTAKVDPSVLTETSSIEKRSSS